MIMRAAGKEIVAAAMVMMSFTMMLTLAAEYEIPLGRQRYYSYGDDEAENYKEEGISMVPKGCPDKCGNVSIYYPFGIGPSKDCYLNKWYLINCTKSFDGVEKPFLSSFSNDKHGVREILHISYNYKSITMKESISPFCQATVGSNFSTISNTKLYGTPFFYSFGYNRFMFYGCGGAVLTTPGEEFIQAGCKLSCSNNTTPPKFAHLSLDSDVKAYQLNFTHSSLNACNYAFFLSTSSSSQFSLQRLSNQPPENLIVPVEWIWTVTRDDFLHLPPSYTYNCYGYEDIYPPDPRSHYWNCDCQSLETGNAYLPNGCQAREPVMLYKEQNPMVPNGCRDKCGNVSINYPFGIGPNKHCYLNKWFLISCTQSSDGVETPYLTSIISDDRAGDGFEILAMSYQSQTITVKESIYPSCQTTAGLANGSTFSNTKLSQSPFFYSYFNNFMLFGCGRAFLSMPDEELEQAGYKLNCNRNTAPKFADECDGINCYYLSLDYDVNTYQVNFAHSSANSCNYAFFLSASSSLPSTLQRLPSKQPEAVVVPVEWRWTVTKDDVPPSNSRMYCSPSTYINPQLQGHNYLHCECEYEEGNPYLPSGCEWTHIDSNTSVKKLPAIIGFSSSFGLVSLIWGCVILYKAIKMRKIKKQRQKFFKRNGGLLLQQQLLAKEGTIEKAKIFTASELDKATDHFNANRIVGRGGQGTVYKGMLIDSQIVAVKKSQAVDEDQLEPFINEVVILSQINHRNVVKLLGCCLETEVPILVYEFIPNGTLFSLIHNNFGDEFISLSRDIRLRIASEVADALAYLHSATSIPIYHRDVKSGNILLDEKFRAKVSDFGTSRSISIDQTHLTTIVKGTFGYLDPEYFWSSQFTEKSDVYSFGVVLAELLTGQKPISFEVSEDEDRSLVGRFLLRMEENRLMEILDAEVLEKGKKEDVEAIAGLAQRCLNLNGKKMPTMKEVAAELDAIRASNPHLPAAMETLETESDFIA